MDKEVDEFLEKSGFARDDSRFKFVNIITSPLAKDTLGYEQMDFYSPIKTK